MQISPQLEQSQPCSQAPLLADAQAQAKAVATAAGVSAGAILSMSEGVPGVAALQAVPTFAVSGSFISGLASFVTPPALPTLQPTCTLTVEFQLM